MKICHIISSLDIGGSQKILIQLCGSLNKPDFNHFVINLGEDTQLAKSMRDKGITVYSLSITSILKLIVNFFKLLKVLN